MCTLVLLLRPSRVLAISGNRNELLMRPASGPLLRDGVLAPRDEAAHGTWLGLNRHGLFVCVTNRRGGVLDPLRRSRGLLVRDALRASSARELHAQLASLPGDRHNGFHLVYADLREAFVSWSDGASLTQLALAPEALHLVTERSFGAGEGERERSIRAAFGASLPLDAAAPSLELGAASAREPLDPGAAAAASGERLSFDARGWRVPMTAHARAPLESACVHAEVAGYGTRSSLQLFLRPDRAELLWTDGHPCVNPARDLSAMAAALLQPPLRG